VEEVAHWVSKCLSGLAGKRGEAGEVAPVCCRGVCWRGRSRLLVAGQRQGRPGIYSCSVESNVKGWQSGWEPGRDGKVPAHFPGAIMNACDVDGVVKGERYREDYGWVRAEAPRVIGVFARGTVPEVVDGGVEPLLGKEVAKGRPGAVSGWGLGGCSVPSVHVHYDSVVAPILEVVCDVRCHGLGVRGGGDVPLGGGQEGSE